ncbi:hypothetical protein Tco_0813360 [Tanacetum coccineum]
MGENQNTRELKGRSVGPVLVCIETGSKVSCCASVKVEVVRNLARQPIRMLVRYRGEQKAVMSMNRFGGTEIVCILARQLITIAAMRLETSHFLRL